MQMPNIGTHSQWPRLIGPVSLIAVGIALCVLLSLREGRINSSATNTSSSFSASNGGISLGADYVPHPDLSPKEVVERQMAAIKAARDDARQIGGCYAFASPSNRLMIGSAENLLTVIRANYSSLMSSDIAEVGKALILEREAAVMVTVIDSNAAVHAYRFFLSRQMEPPYKDCWMTDAVVQLRSVSDPQETVPSPSTTEATDSDKPNEG